jgi:excisionase family DNA binding protein
MNHSSSCIDLSTRLALRPTECAASLGITEKTLRKWMRDEGLPFFRVERGIFIPRTQLEAWMAQRLE